MKTMLHKEHAGKKYSAEAETILRSCVHCGFCNASCPTYLTLGDERDGPRGRIYLIKQMLETNEVSNKTLTHLDRCLNCNSCETTCPSDVQFGNLLDIGRNIAESRVKRTMLERIKRFILRKTIPYKSRVGLLLHIARVLRPVLPMSLSLKIPAKEKIAYPVKVSATRKMLVLEGCVQHAATPRTNEAAKRVLAKLDITLRSVPGAGCCGAVSYHLAADDEAREFMRRNIDAWCAELDDGVEAIVISASGCGVMVREYGRLFSTDPLYAKKAQRVSDMARDLSEILLQEDLGKLKLSQHARKIAVHTPCTLQHGLGMADSVEEVLSRLGFRLALTRDKHLCCGSAGTYSLLQPLLSNHLQSSKLSALLIDDPARIVTANVGCQLHLGSRSGVPVQHWIELLDEMAL